MSKGAAKKAGTGIGGRWPLFAAVLVGGAAVLYGGDGLSAVPRMRDRLSSAWQRAFTSRVVLAEAPVRPQPPPHPIYAVQHAATLPPPLIAAVLRQAQHRRLSPQRADTVGAVDAASVASNDPVEDRLSVHRFRLPFTPSSPVWVLGMYDGHAGHHCAHILADRLPHVVATHATPLLINQHHQQPHAVKDALVRAFDIMDADLYAVATHPDVKSHPAALLPMLAGAVVLVSLIAGDHLYVASAGDVRAVLGSKSPSSGSIEAKALSTDHNLRNPAERKRLLAEHPGEPESVLCNRNRILGRLEPSRAFGDFRYKLTADQLKAINDSFAIHHPDIKNELIRSQPMAESKTPPYVTASPEVTHHLITPNDQFLILATDGLWDRLSNEDAVRIVSEYMANPKQGDTAATYLIRESLSIDQRKSKPLSKPEKIDVLSSVLSVPPPYSRMVRDDITVTVVFLNDAADAFQSTWADVSNVATMKDDEVSQESWLDAVLKQLTKAKL